MQDLKGIIKGSYILCFCEGGAEEAIMDMLLDNNMLFFSRSDLIQKRVHRRLSVRKTESKFLNQDFEKPVVILRILDSKNEQFKLKKVYHDRFAVHSCHTKPEVEILIIHDTGMFKDYLKVKTTSKPSEFCKSRLGIKNAKSYKFIQEYFSIDSLIEALRTYKRKCTKNHYTIYDLLRN